MNSKLMFYIRPADCWDDATIEDARAVVAELRRVGYEEAYASTNGERGLTAGAIQATAHAFLDAAGRVAAQSAARVAEARDSARAQALEAARARLEREQAELARAEAAVAEAGAALARLEP
jgi:hypothetical protein